MRTNRKLVGNAKRRHAWSAVSAWARTARSNKSAKNNWSAREHIHDTVIQGGPLSRFAGTEPVWL